MAEFILVTLALQVAGKITEAAVATRSAASKAQDLCDTYGSIQAGSAAFTQYIAALNREQLRLDEVQKQLDEINQQIFYSDQMLVARKRAFVMRLAITVIIGICTTVVAIFTIMRRSDALSDQLAKLSAHVSS